MVQQKELICKLKHHVHVQTAESRQKLVTVQGCERERFLAEPTSLAFRNGESSAFTTTIHPEVVSEIMYLNVTGLDFEALSKYLGVAFG